MPKIQLTIKNCQECPFFQKERNYTGDSFETEFKWTCNKKKRIIRHSVEWNEESRVKIPDWCPIKVD